ncbi:MAG: sodium:solute symporter family protein [Candidatus Hydrogenedentes bacterium]|nr:sodium:solute symporter family protein [Candidatus Hydrogenedentota bacterium]
MNLVLLGVLVYVAIQLAIGLLVSRNMTSESEYFLAGRRLKFGIATMTVFATWFGAETCIGSAGAVYEEGLAGGRADPFGYALCIFFMGALFAVPLWKRKLTTLGDLFRIRYSRRVEELAVLLMVPGSVMWAAAQIKAFGHVIDVTSDLGAGVGITVAAAVVITYTVAGGLLADAVTDVIQGVALIIGLAVLFISGIYALGGVEGAVASVEPERLRVFSGDGLGMMERIEAWAIPIFGSVMSQELVARTLAARSANVARAATLTASGLYICVGLIPAMLGLVGPALVPGLEDPEQLLPAAAMELLPTFLYILFAGALISAILSTVDSALLAASALISHNLIVPFFKGANDRMKVRTARVTVVILGLIAYGLAWQSGGVYELVEEASAFGSAGIFIVVVFALFGKYGGNVAAFLSLAVGGAMWIFGSYVFEVSYPYLLSLLSAFLVYVIIGWFERTPPTPELLPEASPSQ